MAQIDKNTVESKNQLGKNFKILAELQTICDTAKSVIKRK